MTAYVSIAVADRHDILAVPNAALRFKPANEVKNNNQTLKNNPSQTGGAKGAAKKSPNDGFSGKVYVLKKGKIVPVAVKLGITDNRNTEIISDEIKAGDQLILGDAQAASAAPASGSPPPRMRMF
jgi:HlyD family secretion protein